MRGKPPKPETKVKKRNDSRDSDDHVRHLPAWLEEFTDNLEDTEVLTPAHMSQESDSERSSKVESMSRKHGVHASQKTEIATSAC